MSSFKAFFITRIKHIRTVKRARNVNQTISRFPDSMINPQTLIPGMQALHPTERSRQELDLTTRSAKELNPSERSSSLESHIMISHARPRRTLRT